MNHVSLQYIQLVADWSNDRVVLLGPSLAHLGYITLPGHELRHPYALHFEPLYHRYISARVDQTWSCDLYSVLDQLEYNVDMLSIHREIFMTLTD